MNKKAQELRDLSTEELEATYFDECKELFALRNELSANKKLDKPHLISSLKKRIARILTIIQERAAAK